VQVLAYFICNVFTGGVFKKSFWKEFQALLQRITKNKIGAVTGGAIRYSSE
jgi:hypothetical protein